MPQRALGSSSYVWYLTFGVPARLATISPIRNTDMYLYTLIEAGRTHYIYMDI